MFPFFRPDPAWRDPRHTPGRKNRRWHQNGETQADHAGTRSLPPSLDGNFSGTGPDHRNYYFEPVVEQARTGVEEQSKRDASSPTSSQLPEGVGVPSHFQWMTSPGKGYTSGTTSPSNPSTDTTDLDVSPGQRTPVASNSTNPLSDMMADIHEPPDLISTGLPPNPENTPSLNAAAAAAAAASGSMHLAAGTFAPAIPPEKEDEDAAVADSPLAHAWFWARQRREQQRRFQQQRSYPIYPPMFNGGQGAPMMDPRTGGFVPAPAAATASAAANMYMANPGAMMGPVDVDTGGIFDASAYMHPFAHPHPSQGTIYEEATAIPYAFDDTLTVVSKPNSLASFPSATTSDMTPVVSNVTFPQPPHPRYAGSSYAGSSYLSPLTGDNQRGMGQPQEQAGGESHGRWYYFNSCKGFLDFRTSHGKLAILLVIILILAIATLVVSLALTIRNGKHNNSFQTSQQIGSPSDAVPTNSPTPLIPTAMNPAVSYTPPPSFSHTNTPTAVKTRAPTNIPTSSPTFAPTMAPSFSHPTFPPTDEPTVRPVTAAPTTNRPTLVPTVAASAAPTTPIPTNLPTQDLQTLDLILATTVQGSANRSGFGTSVALSDNGEILAVGAPWQFGRMGQVVVLAASESLPGEWEVRQFINGTNVQGTMGESVALSEDGSVLAIGEPGYNGRTGAVRVYTYNPGTNDYEILGDEIFGSTRRSSFGHTISLSQDGFRVAIGAPYYSGPDSQPLSGQVAVYELRGLRWELVGEPQLGYAVLDWLGSAVDLSGDGNIVVASAPQNKDAKGYVRAWRWFNDAWEQMGQDINNTVAPTHKGDRFGHSIALSKQPGKEPRLAIGASWKTVAGFRNAGMVIVYEFDEGLGEWVQLGQVITREQPAGHEEMGNAVDLDGGILSVGIPGANLRAGAVELYRYLNGVWVKRDEILNGTQVNDDFGVSLSSRRDTRTDGFALVVGALTHSRSSSGYVASYVKQ